MIHYNNPTDLTKPWEKGANISPYKTIDFSKRSSIRVGPVANVYMIDSLEYPDGAYLIGSANNLLIGPQHPPLMKLSKAFDYIKIINNKVAWRITIDIYNPLFKCLLSLQLHTIKEIMHIVSI